MTASCKSSGYGRFTSEDLKASCFTPMIVIKGARSKTRPQILNGLHEDLISKMPEGRSTCEKEMALIRQKYNQSKNQGS
jgi:hypothetical protein